MKLKNFFLPVIIALSVTKTASAQQHEFRIGTGFPTYPYIKQLSPSMCDCGDDIKWEGTYNLEYYYQVVKGFKIGISYTFESQHHFEYSIMPGYENSSDISRKMFHTFLFNTSRQWINTKWVELYSTIGVGMSVYIMHYLNGSADQNNSSQIKPAYQISPFGIRVGKQWGGFFELGFGYRGILSGGISYRL